MGTVPSFDEIMAFAEKQALQWLVDTRNQKGVTREMTMEAMMDDADAKVLLLNIRRMALEHYRFPEGTVIDPRYEMALGLIAGACTEAIQAVQQNRKARFQLDAPS